MKKSINLMNCLKMQKKKNMKENCLKRVIINEKYFLSGCHYEYWNLNEKFVEIDFNEVFHEDNK